MSMYDWAERECRLACKKENPNYDFDSDDFDYGCSCYKSALKAFKSLCEDEHSGTSIKFTQRILNKLIDGTALTPIEDSDFFNENGEEIIGLEPEEYLKERGLKSDMQCPRMYSLFRTETLDGKVTYHDNDRARYTDVEYPSDTFYSSTKFLDEMFPITMPYSPSNKPFKIYARTFLSDKKNGDFDTRHIMYVITPDGEKIDINIYEGEKDGKWQTLTKEEYEERLKNRVDKINEKSANHLLWTLISNSIGSDEEIDALEQCWSKMKNDPEHKTEIDDIYNTLYELCMFFENPDNWKYNTFRMFQALCHNKRSEFAGIEELEKIADYLLVILDKLANYRNLKN